MFFMRVYELAAEFHSKLPMVSVSEQGFHVVAVEKNHKKHTQLKRFNTSNSAAT